MAIYGYECEGCKNRIEKFEQMDSPRLNTCPSCGGVLRQLFYPYVIFMGKSPQSFHNKFAYPHHGAEPP